MYRLRRSDRWFVVTNLFVHPLRANKFATTKSPRFAKNFALLLLAAALFSSCGRREVTTGDNGSTGQQQKKALANHDEIDQALTEAANEALGDHEGSVLVMDPHTGRLRAVVNPRLAFEQAFPPGSTIKSFTALTAMRGGLLDVESGTVCPGRFSGESIDIVCAHPKSTAPFNLAKALGYSCNYFFARLSGRLSFDAFKSTLASAGLGAKTGVNASGESAGALGEGEWRIRNLLGEGDNLLVTPIQLLTAYSALMNGGHLYRPQVAEAEKFAGDERGSFYVDPSQRTALIEGMRGAIVYGTAQKAGLNELPMFIFGKTGSSTSSNGFRRQGWFVSFAADARSPAEVNPESLELAVLVFLKRSHGSDAAVVSRRVFEGYVQAKRVGEERRGETAGRGRVGREKRGGDTEMRRGGEENTIRVKLLSENRVVPLSLEQYVLGVLGVEASLEDETEALKAQAIVTRTYARRNLARHAGEDFDLCSNTHCQQYVSPDGRASEKMQRAVIDTTGETLLDSNRQLADAYFHAACGGMTANIGTLWGVRGPRHLGGVRDDYCANMPNNNWTDELPADKLARALATDRLTDAGRRIDEIVVTRKDATGRAELISIEGERRRLVRGWEFKMIVGRSLGWNLLKSSRFSVSRRGSSFIFRGSGFGHGLGLCQNGAHVMARRGATSDQILDHYFPGTRVSRPTSVASAAELEPRAIYYPVRVSSLMPTDSTRRRTDFVMNGPTELRSVSSPAPHRLTLSSGHFRINYPVQTRRTEVEAALRALQAARSDMSARLKPASLSVPEGLIEVVIHKTTADFTDATGQPWWVAAVTRGQRMEIQPLEVLRRRRVIETTLRHEYAHAVIEALGQANAPRWLAEGLAVHFADEGPLIERYRSKSRMTHDELERRLAHPVSAAEMRSLYANAYIEVRVLIRREGEPSVWRRLLGARTSRAQDLPASI